MQASLLADALAFNAIKAKLGDCWHTQIKP